MITSTRNPRVREVVALHRRRHREQTGLILLEGPKLLAEAVAAGIEIQVVFATVGDPDSAEAAAKAGAEFLAVDDPVLRRMATTERPQSPVAVAAAPGGALPPDGHLLVSWGMGDPGNVGTLIRTAAAFGLGSAAGPGTADPWSPKVLRAGAGAQLRTPPGRVETLEALRATGRRIAAAVPRGGEVPASLGSEPGAADWAVLVGDEASGLPEDVIDRSDLRVSIPMPGGGESLNAAVAGAVIAYELACGGGDETGD
jgi:TrmH family RNA methyltransferase